MKTDTYQSTRWILPKPVNLDFIDNINLNCALQKVLIRRGIDSTNKFEAYISPAELPNPEEHFNELFKATQRIIQACKNNDKIAICGDYDADGITSTVLLVELLSKLGARVNIYIPSRQDEGYGLNINIVNEINNQQIGLIITVDNGVSAFEAIEKTKDLGIDLIITDHHKIPNKQFDVYALIHPELTPDNSPYKYLAGVGIAFLLAKNICYKSSLDINNTSASTLFCIGTVADMAPLKGANRRWLKQYLPKINATNNKGLKSIIKKLSIDKIDISPEDIGYKIAPLINAVGRIGDPKLIIDLFTNESNLSVDKLTKECFALNIERKRVTSLIEHEALEIAHKEYTSNSKFLVLIKREWHPGIIGIVAARIVDKFNLPTAILSEANDGNYRGSIRSNKILKVNCALDECSDLLIAHGGHSAAAGFSIKKENISDLKHRLNIIATREFRDIDLTKSIMPEAHLCFQDINHNFYRQLCLLGPFGIMNPAPIFWTRKCKVVDIYKLKGGHLKIILNDGTSSINAIKWNESFNLCKNELLDITYYIEINKWKNRNKLQLNLVDIKKHKKIVDIHLYNRVYKCQFNENKDILITNSKGECFSSDLSIVSENLNSEQKIFAKKILSYAEIALGKAA